MLERMGLASKAVIDGAALSFHRQHAQKAHATIDDWRRSIKEHFRQRVVDKLANPALDDAASYRQLRFACSTAWAMRIAEPRRGLVSRSPWVGSKGPPALRRDAHSSTNVGTTETRGTDMIVNGEIREMKDIEGPIDQEQYGAYVDLLLDDKLRQKMGVETLRYVFTKPEGAIANLETSNESQAHALRARLRGGN